MKKYILLLLATASLYGQAYQNPTYGKLKLKNNQTSTTAEKVNVQENDGTINTISKSDLVNYLEFASAVNLPVTGEQGKLYLTKDNNRLYRFNGTIYQELTTDISGKEDIANKQNSLAVDGTNTKYPTVTAVNTGLALKANLASPALTGTPTAPTATAGTNTTQIATTAFVAGGLATKENTFSKNTAFNKPFGITAGTVAEGNHLHSFSDLQNNPTTIAGYGITDANKSPINVNVTTARTTAAKIGTTSSGTYTPSIGDRIDVTFTLGTAIANATLNIDGSGVKAIQLAGTNVTALSLSTPASLVVIPMYYNGTAWQIYGSTMSADTNTTYIEATTGLVVTTSTQAVAVNTLYYANNASNVAFTLPTTCAVNSIVHIVGMNSTGTYSVIAPSGDNIILEGFKNGTSEFIYIPIYQYA